jgi:Thioredoxin like C-terminal domain
MPRRTSSCARPRSADQAENGTSFVRDCGITTAGCRSGVAACFGVTGRVVAPDDAHGSDVNPDGGGTVSDQRTYQLIRQPGPIADRRFEVEFQDAGVEAYCFTFG